MTKNWTVYLTIAAAVVLMLVTGYVQGVWSERWGTFPELKIFADQLTAVPRQIGEWQGTDGKATDARVLAIAGAEGELVRNYKNSRGEEVQVQIICGRLRDITYHSPDRCFPAAGFDMQNSPQRDVIELPGGGDAQFFTANFSKSEPTGTHAVRGYWSWTGDGNWLAPDNTKFEFASQQEALYKLYVFANIPSTPKRGSDLDFCNDFMQMFVPALNDALRPAFERAGRVESGVESPEPTADAPSDAAAEPVAGEARAG